MRISDWSSDVCSSDLGRSPASEIVIDLCRGHDPGIPDVAVLVQEADRSLRQVRHVDRLLGGQAADLDAAFEPATVRLHVAEQHGTADRNSAVAGKSASVRVDPGRRPTIKKHNHNHTPSPPTNSHTPTHHH